MGFLLLNLIPPASSNTRVIKSGLMIMKYTPIKTLIVILSFLASTATWASEVDRIIAREQAPEGVVFEIVSDDDDLLGELLPSVKADIKKLRQRFPDLPIAIVSHGKEQFALTSRNRSSKPEAHDLVKELVSRNDVDVHVCGTHAGWYGVSAEDFPDYVDVSTTGPAQINDYEAIGYELIILTE